MRYDMLHIESLSEYKLEYFQQIKEDVTVYQKMYYTLFNAITDALAAMEQQNYGQARALLVDAQQQSEELFMDGDADDT